MEKSPSTNGLPAGPIRTCTPLSPDGKSEAEVIVTEVEEPPAW